MSFIPGLFAVGLRPGDVIVQASIALPICQKILEGRLTIVSPSREIPPTTVEEDEEEEGLLNSRLSPIPLEFDPWLGQDCTVRLTGVPPDTPLALIKASLRGEGVPFWWVSWTATPGEALVETRGPEARRALLRRGLLLCGGGPRLRARRARDDQYGSVARSVSAPEGLLEATRCKPFPSSSQQPPVRSMVFRRVKTPNCMSSSQDGFLSRT